MIKKDKKNIFSEKRGFTLIEMLLVVVIIGILAGAIYTMIGDSSNTKTKSALSTMKSIMPYAQECSFKGNDLMGNDSNKPEKDLMICTDSETIWPGLGPKECVYEKLPTDNAYYSALCTFSSDNVIVITCTVADGLCASAVQETPETE